MKFLTRRTNYLLLFLLIMRIDGYANQSSNIPKLEVINVKQHGAVGDGKTDDYMALKAIFEKVSQKRGAHIFFPKGVYYIAQYHTKTNKISDLIIENCNGLKISGKDAVIQVNGNFKRTADRRSKNGKHTYSYNNAIIPFLIKSSNDVVIEGFEINGGVKQMTRDEGVGEYGGHLIRIMDCNNVLIQNMKLNYAQTDGIVISGRELPSKNVKMINVISEHNARQGMSIGNLVNGEFINCTFRKTGFTGEYGGHSPMAGVDIEPDKLRQGIKTENIRFYNCVIENNKGGQFLCSRPAFTKNVSLEKCVINGSGSKSRYQMVLTVDGVTIDNCKIDCGEQGSIYARWQKLYGSKSEIKNSEIKSKSSGITAMTDSLSDVVKIHNNKIIYTGDSTLKSYFPLLRMKGGLTFTNNEIIIDSKYLRTGISAIVEGADDASGNVFKSDKVGILPRVSYAGSKNAPK